MPIEEPILPSSAAIGGEMFPTLTPAQVEHLATHGKKRRVEAGEVLVELGQDVVPFFVIVEGRVVVYQVNGDRETPIASHGPGQFTGEANLLAGRRSLSRARVVEPGEVIEIDRATLLEIVQSETAISDIVLRAFLRRRGELVMRGLGDAVILGSMHCASTLRIKEFLNRNGHPYTYVDLDEHDDVQELLDHFHVTIDDVPVLVCRGELVLRNPSNREVAECLGFNQDIDDTQIRDVVVVGAGPAGLAAAVYAASEGLDVVVLETHAPGGQAGSSSRIENYLGFPLGISGQDLASRAHAQAQKFGARFVIANGAAKLACERKPYKLETEDGRLILARSLVLATGVRYRKPDIENLSRFEGAGVYYGATHMEAQICKDEEVIVVGGGNAAGQAAVFLADFAKRVHVLVRGKGLADSMSRYLIHRIELNPAIELRTSTRVQRVLGETHVEKVEIVDDARGATETCDVRHVFVLTGADPSTEWLGKCIALDEKGFVRTGPDITQEDLDAAHWPLERRPQLLETTLPGVFAVGDVRCGNVKRVASAVGEGSIAISMVHQVLKE